MIVNSSSYKTCVATALFLLITCAMGFAQPTISATQLYMEYNDNPIRFEQNYQGKKFYITGEISTIRQGFFGDYVVGLDVPGDWDNLFGATINVVYPKNPSTRELISGMEKGERAKILVKGRTTYEYVDAVMYEEKSSETKSSKTNSSSRHENNIERQGLGWGWLRVVGFALFVVIAVIARAVGEARQRAIIDEIDRE